MDGKKKLEELVAGLDGVTEGPWAVYDGCSWRRIGTAPALGRDCRDDAVLCPIKSPSDGHPDLTCAHGNDLATNLAHIARCDPDTIRSISDAYKAMEAERDELREALNEFMDITEPASVPALRDPAHGDEVEALGRRIGFGALISSASASWRDVAKESGDPPGGEFVVGPCYAVLISVRNRAAAILKGSRHEG